jgi:tripartite-type tricarboxylate transporter receptor subunit TctC
MYVRMFTRRHVVAMLAAAASLAAIPAAQANDAYPAKPIRMVVGFPSGGAPDILARIFSEKFSLGQPVIVDNKPGAGGNIGAETVARSAPDGYTLALGTVGTHSINGALYSKMPYDMVKDFTPVILLASTPNVLVVHPSVPAKNVQELIALAKAKPGQLTFGTPGIGTSLHVAGELFNTMAGTKIEHVPYKGRAMAIPDLLGGHITMMFDNLPSALPVVKEGKLRAGRDQCASFGLRTGHPDHRRAGPARLRGNIVVRGLRAGTYAERDRGQAERRDEPHLHAARRAGKAQDVGSRSGSRDA